MDKPNVCEYCGQEYNHSPIGTAFRAMGGGNTKGYCSQKCWDAAQARSREEERRCKAERLQKMKEKGKKTLAKWEKKFAKDAEKRKACIDKLSAAIRGDDPKAIVKAMKAMKGGFFSQLWRALKAIVFCLGVIVIINWAVTFYMMASGNNGNKRSAGCIEKPIEVVNELPPLEDAQAEPKATSAEVVAPSVEEGVTPADK